MDKWNLKSTRRKHKYLLLDQKKLGHVNFTDLERDSIEAAIRRSDFPVASELLPFSYIRRIESSVSSTVITIYYQKDSNLDYEFIDVNDKDNFLNKLAKDYSELELVVMPTTIFQSIKIQLIALTLLIVHLGWCYASAYAIETGQHPGRDLAIVLLFASLGTKYLHWIIASVLLLLGVKIYHNINTRENIQVIDFQITKRNVKGSPRPRNTTYPKSLREE